MGTDKVKVAVRVRPFNRRELELGTQCVVEMSDQQTVLFHPSAAKGESRKPPKTFAFDKCLWSFNESDDHFASQEAVYRDLGEDILDNAFQGYNACILAYGQTGSGKSYSMMGSEDNKGLIPRLCDALFERIAAFEDSNNSYTVEVSYMEIYNEKVHDLLDPKGSKQHLKVREHGILGPYVDGLSTLAVSSYEAIDNLMTEGNKSRTVAATNMNSESSRSHAVFNIILTCAVTDSASGVSGEKVSKMSLVDLAGSERAVKTGAVGERLKEGSNINKSLTTLGLVISKLADQASGKSKDKFVPYRDSVLTWLLKDNLGGNSRTVMIATISPAADNYEETLSTLRYADRAKRIVNHAVINEDPNARIIRELREEVETLREQLKHAAQQEDLRERLLESEKLMQEMTQTWEEKLSKSENIHQERQQNLEKMGISVQASGIKVEQDKYYLVNLNADPSLNELLVYYLKEHTLIGRQGAPVEQDIQLSGLGIMIEHSIITIEIGELYITPLEGARTCVNGSEIGDKTQLLHGDRVLWGINHFFRVNCPKAASTPIYEVPERPIDYEFAREELMMKELSNDPIQSAMKSLEKQHNEDKHNALEKQRQMYEKQLQMLRNQMSPSTPYAPYSMGNFDPLGLGKLTPSGLPSPSVQSRMDKWAKERDELFKKSLAKLREDIIKANSLVREANTLAEEMGKNTEFKVTLQIPAANLSPNRKRGAFVSEPAILVKRATKGSQVWSMEKLENKLIDMREMYEERKDSNMLMKDILAPKELDPFYESQENHNLIGVANIFLEVFFHDVKLHYQVPIISQQGEVAGRLHIEVSRVTGSIPERLDASSLDISSDSEDIMIGRQATIRVFIKAAAGLPPSLSNFVFCQYTFWGYPETIVVAPNMNPECPAAARNPGKDTQIFRFDHVHDFTVTVNEEFVEHCSEGALSIEVWGHRSAGFSSSPSGWEVDDQLKRSRSLADRWAELTRKIELWVDVLELNELGDYAAVEVQPKLDCLTGGIYQLRQGQQRRVVARVQPVHNSGTLPIICEAITSVAVGCICGRSKLQKPLDSYQEEDLSLLREKWSEALMRRREYLDHQIQKIIGKQDKSDQDNEREQSLIDQWVCLTEERNAVLVPAPGSGIPGAPADWEPPLGMENHIPVIFLNLNADNMGAPVHAEDSGVHVAGANSILPKEHGSNLFNLPILKHFDKDVCAVAAWDSSIHDSVHLNRVTQPNERVYMILKVCVRLTHPATMDLILRKRISINVYKKQSIADRIKKKIARQDILTYTGVTYEVVANIPKASEDPEDRETLALMAASGEDATASDGESYIEKYTRGVSAVESILTLDRLRQEVAVKELLAAQGRPLRKTASVPNIAHIIRLESGSGSKLEDQLRSDSVQDLTMHALEGLERLRRSSSSLMEAAAKNVALLAKESKSPSIGHSSLSPSSSLARPTFLNLSFNLNLSLRQATMSKPSPLSSISPQPTKLVKPMRTLLEEQTHREVSKPLLEREESEESAAEEEESSKPKQADTVEEKEEEADEEDNDEEEEEEFTEFTGVVSSLPAGSAIAGDVSSPAVEPDLPTSMKHSSTCESLLKAGTPSVVSSGYGSQGGMSMATPMSSDDSVSLRSMGISMDGTPDSDVHLSTLHNGYSSSEMLLDKDVPVDSSTNVVMSDKSVVRDFPGESVPVASQSILEEQEEDSSISDQTMEQAAPEPQPVVVRRRLGNQSNQYASHRASYPATGVSQTPREEQLELRARLAELHLEKSLPSNTVVENGTAVEQGHFRHSHEDMADQDDSMSVSSFGSKADLYSSGGDVSFPPWLAVGESISISPFSKRGVIAYLGPTEFAPGPWAGIELDTPTGKNDGSVNGVRYFQCKPRFGIFVRPDKLTIDKRGKDMRANRHSIAGDGALRRARSKGEGLSSFGDNFHSRSRSRGEGLSSLGLSRSRSKGEGLERLSRSRLDLARK